MATDQWVTFGGVELINLSRTAQLAQTLGIDMMWVDPDTVAWVQDELDGAGYDNIATAPWYDPGFPASAEFAGIVPLSIVGWDDSTREATTTEYITSGGSSGRARSKTLSIVANVGILASTSRGADFGKRWMDRVLSGETDRTFCSGSELRYFQHAFDPGLPAPPQAHRRNVSVTRGTSVTRKRSNDCSVLLIATFTWTADDPFEYGEESEQLFGLGSAGPYGVGVTSFGTEAMAETGCPVFDYSPIYDPLYPALVPPPSAPDFYPEGWDITEGEAFTRHWARITGLEPSSLDSVPVVTLTTSVPARMVRVAVWSGSAVPSDQCDPLWVAILTYVPDSLNVTIDGEQQASYAWDGVSPVVRRVDSLVYGPEARPLRWASLRDPAGFIVTLDVLGDGVGSVRAALSLVPKSN